MCILIIIIDITGEWANAQIYVEVLKGFFCILKFKKNRITGHTINGDLHYLVQYILLEVKVCG